MINFLFICTRIINENECLLYIRTIWGVLDLFWNLHLNTLNPDGEATVCPGYRVLSLMHEILSVPMSLCKTLCYIHNHQWATHDVSHFSFPLVELRRHLYLLFSPSLPFVQWRIVKCALLLLEFCYEQDMDLVF